MYDVVPYEELIGWQARCACGWAGSTWRRTETLPGDHGGRDADDARLPDGTTVDDAARAEWQRHIAPLDKLAAVRAAARTAAAARRALDDAVAAARAGTPTASWADIGSAAGMSKQSAHERWGRDKGADT